MALMPTYSYSTAFLATSVTWSSIAGVSSLFAGNVISGLRGESRVQKAYRVQAGPRPQSQPG